ncbi:MAG: SDR family NAD(P)-dependent oxidoreductase [Elstera sp.]
MIALPKTPSFRLDGRRALVTGAGRGLGLAIAAALAEAGAFVTLVARSETEIAEAAAALIARGDKAESLALDVSDSVAVATALAARPAYDILINNAGTNRPKPMAEVTAEDYHAVMDLNVEAVFRLTQSVTGRMLAEGKRGTVISISSQMGHVGAANRTLYCASKHAIEGMTKALAVELGPHGIRVNSIAPTFFETPLTRPYFDDPVFKASVLSKIKLGRVGQPEDIMGAVVFLASDAAAMITGTSLLVDGGWTAE